MTREEMREALEPATRHPTGRGNRLGLIGRALAALDDAAVSDDACARRVTAALGAAREG